MDYIFSVWATLVMALGFVGHVIAFVTSYIITAVALSYALWIFFLAVMNLKRIKDLGRLSKPSIILGYPVLIVGYVLDAITNIFVVSILFWEIPRWRETTVTARFSRFMREGTWRAKYVNWIAPNLLDDFDPSGKHIK